jgi:hypothetical protein
MELIKVRLADKFTYINIEKILFFEENRVGFTELHLDSGETLVIPIEPEQLAIMLTRGPEQYDHDSKALTPADLTAIFK